MGCNLGNLSDFVKWHFEKWLKIVPILITMYDVQTTLHHLIITLDVNIIETQFKKCCKKVT